MVVTEKTTNDPLLILRALACLTIVWTHSYPSVPLSLGPTDLTALTHPNSAAAVFIFYFLSAYGVGYGFASGKYKQTFAGLKHFLTTRILRIVPLYYVCIMIIFFVVFRGVALPPQALIKLLTFTATNPGDLPVFAKPWFMISTEMQFYLIAPFLFLIVDKLFRKLPFAVSAVSIILFGTWIRSLLLGMGIADDGTYVRLVYSTVLGNIDTFLLGLLVSIRVHDTTYDSRRIAPVPIILFSLAFIAWYAWTTNVQYMILHGDWFISWRNQTMFVLPPATSLLTAWFVLLVARTNAVRSMSSPTPHILFQRIMNPTQMLYGIGILSYGLYLWHAPIAARLFELYGVPNGTVPSLYRMGIIVGLALLLAFISYILIEIPFGKLKTKTVR